MQIQKVYQVKVDTSHYLHTLEVLQWIVNALCTRTMNLTYTEEIAGAACLQKKHIYSSRTAYAMKLINICFYCK